MPLGNQEICLMCLDSDDVDVDMIWTSGIRTNPDINSPVTINVADKPLNSTICWVTRTSFSDPAWNWTTSPNEKKMNTSLLIGILAGTYLNNPKFRQTIDKSVRSA
jgi:hypothetical protein